MTLLGTALKNRRCGDAFSAWNRPNLQGPERLGVTSPHFQEGGPIPVENAGKRIGGRNISPELAWTSPPTETVQLVLVIEDLDVPLSKPAVHCLALIDPAQLRTPHQLPVGALSARDPAAGVLILRSTVTRGYHGPEPIKGHGPHRYTFQLFALAATLSDSSIGQALGTIRPRALLSAMTAPVADRGRLTGTFER